MEAASPARLYVTVVGALLLALGIVGFFYSASFHGFASTETALRVLRVNGWLNLIRIVTGALALLLASAAARLGALGLGVVYLVLAVSGVGNGFDLALGLLGLLAAVATPQPAPQEARPVKPKRKRAASKPRAKPAGEGP